MANIIDDSQVVQLFTNNVVADSVSDAVNRALYEHNSVQFESAGIGTLLVEGSLNGDDWVVLDADQDPDTIITIPQRVNWIRVTRDNTTDSVNVWLASYDHHG